MGAREGHALFLAGASHGLALARMSLLLSAVLCARLCLEDCVRSRALRTASVHVWMRLVCSFG
eukprot:2996795-Pleurochrysis_carterae.AAC.1